MIVSVTPSTISGSVDAPASKSAMQRACAAALVRKGETIIHNPGISADDQAAISVIQQLGANVMFSDRRIIVNSNGIHPVSGTVHCGESGLGMRMFTPLAALGSVPVTITGERSLADRPMHFFDEILPRLNVQVRSNEGKLPLTVQGPLRPANIEIDGSLSSQFLTGLLMAYSAVGARNVTIKVADLKSRPYIDLTLQVMRDIGLRVPVCDDYRSFYFDDLLPDETPSTIEYTVEGDWSGAALLLVAGAITGNVTVKGLNNASLQADRAITAVLTMAGAKFSTGSSYIKVVKDRLLPFVFDATDCPDLFPPLVALAASCKGVSTIKGLRRLKHKESDRGLALQEEFRKLGVLIELDDEEMCIHGIEQLRVQDVVLHSHNDHRIAMACAVASLNADREVMIQDAGAVKKSYPDFWDHLKQLNAAISLNP